ncbi:MAG: phosphate ABC transporter substrate-binding protein [bacterium]|nr:phosphate ABC transporter substrate-binding protein [bacterium]
MSLRTESYAQPVKVDSNIAGYVKGEPIKGNLNSIGSDTLNNLMTFWSEEFSRQYPAVKIQVEGKGSSTAPPALIANTAQLAPMSREMKGTEIDAFEKKFGYKPTQVRVAVDALAVFVNKDNPIKGLTLQQVDAIFSRSLRRGATNVVQNWGQVGLTADWARKPISLYGRNSASGTYGFFKDAVLQEGDFLDRVKEQPGSASVVQGVATDITAIGYSGVGYMTSSVRALALDDGTGTGFIEPSADSVYAGEYPLSRFLYVYINKAPGEKMDRLTMEFLRLILSRQGQEIVVKDGYYPLPGSVVIEELEKFGRE